MGKGIEMWGDLCLFVCLFLPSHPLSSLLHYTISLIQGSCSLESFPWQLIQGLSLRWISLPYITEYPLCDCFTLAGKNPGHISNPNPSSEFLKAGTGRCSLVFPFLLLAWPSIYLLFSKIYCSQQYLLFSTKPRKKLLYWVSDLAEPALTLFGLLQS